MLSRLAGAQAPRVLAPSLLRPRILRLAGTDRGFKSLLRAFSDAKPVEDAPTRDLREEKFPVAKEYWNDVSRDADLWPGMESKQLVRARAELEAGATQYAFGLHPDAGWLGNSGLVSKYGRYTMLTAAGLILVGNEFLLLNSELLHVIPHYIILLLLWAKAAPMIQETVTARRNKRLKWWNDLYDSSVHNQRLLLARVRRQYDFPKLMTKMLDDTRAVSQQAAAALLYTARQRHAAQLTGMLQAAAHMEKQQLEDLQADYIDTAAKFVMYSYAYPTTKEKSVLLKLSLLRVLGFGRRELPNPLTEQFGKYSKYYSAVVAEFKKQSTSPPYRPRLTGEGTHTSNIEVCALIQQRFSAPDTVWFYDYIPQVHIFLASAMLTELNQRAPRAEILAVVDREIAGLPEAIRAEARQQLLAGVEGDTSAAATTSKPKQSKK